VGDILAPIASYGETGLPMMSGDRVWRHCHPIFAVFIGNYPEQALVTCMYYGRCPKCTIAPDELGKYQTFPRRMQSKAIETYLLADDENVHAFHLACHEDHLKPVFWPFWACLPLVDIFISITADILHQMLQGMMKHLIKWLVKIFGSAAIDSRCKAMLPNHKTTLFAKGISTLSRVSGQEHKRMCAILFGLVVDLPLAGGMDSSCLIRAVRVLLDF
jgi:hypothetical protein